MADWVLGAVCGMKTKGNWLGSGGQKKIISLSKKGRC